MKAIIIEKTECPKCGYGCDRVTNLKGIGEPAPGDFSICMKCGQINQFNDEVKLKRPSNEFMLELAKEYPLEYLQLVEYSNKIKKADILKYYKKT